MKQSHVLSFLIFFLASTAHASLNCSKIFSDIYATIPEYHISLALDARDYREGALQIFNNHVFEARVSTFGRDVPAVFIESYEIAPKLTGFVLKKIGFNPPPHTMNSKKNGVAIREVPEAVTIAEIPELPGFFVVGKRNGEVEVVSYDFKNPRIGINFEGKLEAWEAGVPEFSIVSIPEKFSGMNFVSRERVMAQLNDLTLTSIISSPARLASRNNKELFKNRDAILSLVVTQSKKIWLRNISGETYPVSLARLMSAPAESLK